MADARNKPSPAEIFKLATKVANSRDADVFLYSGDLFHETAEKFIATEHSDRRENVCFFLTTYGGNPHSAYKMARCFRRRYKTMTAYIFGPCASAGTLFVVGADQIVMGELGELGPLDVQMQKPDEIVLSASGLDIFQAVNTIRALGGNSFETYLFDILEESRGSLSARTAAEIARELTVGLLSPLSAQIDPIRLGEAQRAISIARSYGSKLNRGNLKKDSLEKLISEYPAHSSVIDVDEARELFVRVFDPTAEEQALADSLRLWLRVPARDPMTINVLKTFAPIEPEKRDAAKPTTRSRRTVSRKTNGSRKSNNKSAGPVASGRGSRSAKRAAPRRTKTNGAARQQAT